MNIAILGFDTEGRASLDYFTARGDTVTICDQNPDLVIPDGTASVLGPAYLDDLDRFDLLVRTAGLPPANILEKNPSVTYKITSSTNEFMRVCPTKNVVGVTGTKGKGTTSSLITALLQAADKTVYLGGNIGVPALELLQHDIQPDDYVVLELSSFQLIDIKYSPHIAVCLMMAPEHLNWHHDVLEYYRAKEQLFTHQTADNIAVYYSRNEVSKQIASAGQGQKVPYFEAPGAYVDSGNIIIDDTVIAGSDELQLIGPHNLQNVCAALTAVWNVTHDVEALHAGLVSFKGLPYRLEPVRELDGVRYFNDSFGTTPETATVAVEAFAEPKVIILGGSDKGADYHELAQTIADANMRRVLLIGEQAGRLQAALDEAGYTNYQPGGTTMDEIVASARAVSQPGDVVLLSTGCASFDMFANYKDRGNQFKTAVLALA